MTDIVEVAADVPGMRDAWGDSGIEASRVEACERLEDGYGAMGEGENEEAICAIIPSNWVVMAVMVAAWCSSIR